MNENEAIKDPVMLTKSLVVLGIVLTGFVFHGILHFQPATIALFGAGLFVTVVAVVLLMAWLFGYFAKTQSLGPPASPFTDVRVLPPDPRLQVEPNKDLDRLRAEQEKQLDSYGWVDRNPGVVHIPIERAMGLVAERGLPARAGATKEEPER